MTPEQFLEIAEKVIEVRDRNPEIRMDIAHGVGAILIINAGGYYVGYIDVSKPELVWL